ncbi:MAG: cytochrome c oxidase subunit 3 [Chloroflexota bacterium]
MIARPMSRAREPLGSRIDPTMLGLWVFIATEALFFGMLISSYLYLRVRAGVWPPPDSPGQDLLIPLLNSVVLFSSGATMHGAHLSIRRGDTAVLRGGILATIALGAAFLGGQAYEYVHAGFGLSSGLLGSVFFTLTGFHGAHVFAGLVFLALIWKRAKEGRYTEQHHLGVEASALYWHFVDAVWVVLLTVLYLV